MKKFAIMLFGVIFLTLMASTQFTAADESITDVNIPIKGLFVSDELNDVALVTRGISSYESENADFDIYLQLVIRSENDQLINVTQSTAYGAYIDHMISHHVFETLMSEKEIVTIDGVKYEMSQWEFDPSLEHRFLGLYPIYSEITLKLKSEPGDDSEKMYESKKDHSIWKIHYCADFEGIGYTCVPVFQVLTPTMTLEPTDNVSLKWTILRPMR